MNSDIKINNNLKKIENFAIIEPTFQGGNKIITKDYSYIEFKINGSFTISSNMKCDILIVGGGGGGGSRHGGGGGAGSVIYLTNEILNAGTYSITIGNGGGATSFGQGGKGGNTLIKNNNDIIYLAEGGGAGYHGEGSGYSTRDGGSGGGGGEYGGKTIAHNNIPTGTFGNKGGKFSLGGIEGCWGGGGGGGASTEGIDSQVNGCYATAGKGGDGIKINITGNDIYYGGGGGGGCASTANTFGLGGLGGGGAGSKGVRKATDGTPNTGSGGGGAGFEGGSNGTSGSGGSGIVIIRYFNDNSSTNNEASLNLKRYPPKGWNSITNETDSIINGRSCRFVRFTLNTDNITYGSGTYELYYIPTENNYGGNIFRCFDFNNDINDGGGHTEARYNPVSGVYEGTNFLVDSSYKGSWFVIKMPVSILLTNYYIICRNGLKQRAPNKLRLYGSNDSVNWVLLDDVLNATYNSLNKFNKNIINTTKYIYYGVVINKIIGGADNIGNFIEFVINDTLYIDPNMYDISSSQLTTEPIMSSSYKRDSDFKQNLNEYEYKVIYDISIANFYKDTFDVENIDKSKIEDIRYNKDGSFNSIDKSDDIYKKGFYFKIIFKNDVNIKKYTFKPLFSTKDIYDNLPASWIIYAIKDGNNIIISQASATKEDYLETQYKPTISYTNFILNNNVLAKEYVIVITRNFGKNNMELFNIILESGIKPNVSSTVKSINPID